VIVVQSIADMTIVVVMRKMIGLGVSRSSSLVVNGATIILLVADFFGGGALVMTRRWTRWIVRRIETWVFSDRLRGQRSCSVDIRSLISISVTIIEHGVCRLSSADSTRVTASAFRWGDLLVDQWATASVSTGFMCAAALDSIPSITLLGQWLTASHTRLTRKLVRGEAVNSSVDRERRLLLSLITLETSKTFMIDIVVVQWWWIGSLWCRRLMSMMKDLGVWWLRASRFRLANCKRGVFISDNLLDNLIDNFIVKEVVEEVCVKPTIQGRNVDGRGVQGRVALVQSLRSYVRCIAVGVVRNDIVEHLLD
jgi:hypothetical protein